MRNYLFILKLACIIIYFVSCKEVTVYEWIYQEKNNSITETTNDFLKPPPDYRPSVMVIWDSGITRYKIKLQLEAIAAAGFGGAYIDFLSYKSDPSIDTIYPECFIYAVDVARLLGLKLWLNASYDPENGILGMLDQNTISTYINDTLYEGQALLQYKYTKLVLDSLTGSFLILKLNNKSYEDITFNYTSELRKRGVYYVYKLVKFPAFYLPSKDTIVKPDLFSVGITQRVIDAMQPVITKLSNQQLGATVTGIFTNQPLVETPILNGLRWFPELSGLFKKQWGYPIENYMPCLFETVGNWTKVRHDYYKTLREILIRRWAIPWMDNAGQNKLDWNSDNMAGSHNNDFMLIDKMSVYEYQQHPRLCISDTDFNSPVSYSNTLRKVKEVASVANQLNIKQVSADIFGGCDWDLTFSQMKQKADAYFVMGINSLNHIASYTDITGTEKYQKQISFSAHNSWWGEYSKMNLYYSRLSMLLSSGHQDNKILILEPVSTASMYYAIGKDNNYYKNITYSFNTMIDFFERCHIEYDLGSESVLKNQARVDEDNLVVNNCTYNSIILPPYFENMDSSTFELITEYLKNGGKVITFSDGVKYLEGSWSKDLDELPAKYPSSWLVESTFFNIGLVDELQPLDYQLLNPELVGGELYHIRRKLKDGYILFLTNQSAIRPSQGTIKSVGQKVFALNPMSGEITIYPSIVSFDNLYFDVKINPGGSLLLYVGNSDISQQLMPGVLQTDTIDAAGATRVIRLSENSFPLNTCKIEIDTVTSNEIPVDSAFQIIYSMLHKVDSLINKINLEINYTPASKQQNIHTYKIHYYFESDSLITGTIKMAVAMLQDYVVTVNNTNLNTFTSSWWLDQEYSTLDITSNLKGGTNELVLEYKFKKMPPSVEPVFITGDFSLEPLITGFRIVPAGSATLGSWKDNGLPFYTGALSYTKQFRVKKEDRNQYKVSLGKWAGVVAEVIVNGKSAGIIAWEPSELDVTSLIKAGMNDVEVVVYGSLYNLFNYVNKMPVETKVNKTTHTKIPESIPVYTPTDIVNYGLMDSFYLIEGK